MMRSFILLLVFICAGLTAACGKTGDLYLPGDSSGDLSDEGESSTKTDSATGN